MIAIVEGYGYVLLFVAILILAVIVFASRAGFALVRSAERDEPGRFRSINLFMAFLFWLALVAVIALAMREVAGYESARSGERFRRTTIFSWMNATPNVCSAVKRLWGRQ